MSSNNKKEGKNAWGFLFWAISLIAVFIRQLPYAWFFLAMTLVMIIDYWIARFYNLLGDEK